MKWMRQRGLVAYNPWAGHRISRKNNPGRAPTKRAFSPDELVKLLRGNAAVANWPTKAFLPDLMVLGMYTGVRIEEVCSLTGGNVELDSGSAMLDIVDSKTQAGIRKVAVVHPAALGIITWRLTEKKRTGCSPS